MAKMTGARAICAFTYSGATSRLISKSHPEVDIIGLTPDPLVLTQINLAWGVTPILVNSVPGLDEMIVEVDHPKAGRMKTIGHPVKFSRTPASVDHAAPLLGQHTRDVLGELGLDAARIDGFSEFGIFWRVAIPLVKPAVAALCIFNFIGNWNA